MSVKCISSSADSWRWRAALRFGVTQHAPPFLFSDVLLLWTHPGERFLSNSFVHLFPPLSHHLLFVPNATLHDLPPSLIHISWILDVHGGAHARHGCRLHMAWGCYILPPHPAGLHGGILWPLMTQVYSHLLRHSQSHTYTHTHTVFTARGAARGQAEPAHSQVLRPGMQGREQEIKWDINK